MSIQTRLNFLLMVIVVSLLSACASTGGKDSNKKSTAGVILEYSSCKKIERDVQCELYVTADGRDTTIGISSGKSAAFDDKGNKYLPKKILIGNQEATGNVWTPKFTAILADTKTQVTMLFENVSTKATAIKQLDIDFSTRKPVRTDHNILKFNGNQI